MNMNKAEYRKRRIIKRVEALGDEYYNRSTKRRFRKRSVIFKAANYEFDPINVTATSYSWWHMLREYKGIVIRNYFRYSPSTSKHQGKLTEDMQTAGLKTDLEIECPAGLQSPNWITSALEQHAYLMAKLEVEDAHARHGSNWHKHEIKRHKRVIDRLAELGRMKSKVKALLKTAREEAAMNHERKLTRARIKRKAAKLVANGEAAALEPIFKAMGESFDHWDPTFVVERYLRQQED